MGNGLAKWFVSLSLSISFGLFASDEWSGAFHATLHGKLVKKYFRAPRVVQEPPFGWFVQVDEDSGAILSELFSNLSEREKSIFTDIDLQCVRLMTDKFAVREWASLHCGAEVTIEGDLREPDLFGEFCSFYFAPEDVMPMISEREVAVAQFALEDVVWEPHSLNWSEEDLADESLVLPESEPERLVAMTGKLTLRICNSDPDLGSIETGGQPIYRWILKLNPESFEIACNTPVRASFQTPATIRSFRNCDEMELTGGYDEEWLCEKEGQTVTVEGYLWHAHTGHHSTPVMLDSKPWF